MENVIQVYVEVSMCLKVTTWRGSERGAWVIDFKGHEWGTNTRKAKKFLRKETWHHASTNTQIALEMTNWMLWLLKIKSGEALFGNTSKMLFNLYLVQRQWYWSELLRNGEPRETYLRERPSHAGHGLCQPPSARTNALAPRLAPSFTNARRAGKAKLCVQSCHLHPGRPDCRVCFFQVDHATPLIYHQLPWGRIMN